MRTVEKEPEFISTGIPSLDELLGGGVAVGTITEIYGLYGSGKTTLALTIAGNVKGAAWVDAEHAANLKYYRQFGVEKVLQPDYGEEIIDWVKEEEPTFVVIDSVAALIPRAEIEGTADQANMGASSRLVARLVRTLIAQRVTTIVINQLRANFSQYGEMYTRAGGYALRYMTSNQLEVKKGAPLKMANAIVGSEVVVRLTKSRFATPFREITLPLLYGKGFDPVLLEFQKKLAEGEITRKGAYYYLGEEKLGRGLEEAYKAYGESKSDN